MRPNNDILWSNLLKQTVQSSPNNILIAKSVMDTWNINLWPLSHALSKYLRLYTSGVHNGYKSKKLVNS